MGMLRALRCLLRGENWTTFHSSLIPMFYLLFVFVLLLRLIPLSW